jgi:GNAT superfamily N-acetyltransferase
MFSLRPATADDREFLFSLFAQTMRDVIERTWGWDDAWQRRDFERRFDTDAVFIVESVAKPIGGLFLDLAEDATRIQEVQLLPQYQGLGIGTAIVQGVIRQAQARHVPVELSVVPANSRAQRLYERLGFAVVAIESPFIRMRHPGTTAIAVRLAHPGDVALLPDIERRAASRFKPYQRDLDIPEEMFEGANDIQTLAAAQQAGRLWVAVAGGTPIGFALAIEMEGYAHLEEMDVLPAHAGQGVGSRLLDAVCSWAERAGHRGVTLRTFRAVPWNAPFYQRRGFRIVDSRELSIAHAALEASEHARGLRSDLRVSMVLPHVNP